MERCEHLLNCAECNARVNEWERAAINEDAELLKACRAALENLGPCDGAYEILRTAVATAEGAK